MAISFMGYTVFDSDGAACAREIQAEVISGRRNCRTMNCLNPHSFITAKDDHVFRAALKSSDWLVPDGAGIIMAARWLNLPIRKRVTGSNVFLNVMKVLDKCQGSLFLLGASEDVLERMRSRIAVEYPQVVLAGTYSPPFKPEFTSDENAAMIRAINAVRPDVLWVAMTAPKQEKWLSAHRNHLQVGAAGAVGAAFDFFAGTVRRSPKIFRILGLEWLPRLVQQPLRLWRRTFISAPKFLIEVYRERRRRSNRKRN
jgi:N-acetylglucosaminyldiphosphoundecaprenol N-acetyl-beta-D-mannosaminyltransferase